MVEPELPESLLARLRATLHEHEDRDSFLLRLSDALRPLSDAAQVQSVAARALGEQLGANRCFYVEALDDEDTLQVGPCYIDGVEPMAGRFHISDFDPAILELFRAGRTLVIADAQTSASSTALREQFRASQIRAALAVPLVKEGRLVAILSLHQATVRDWSDSQVKLTEEVAQRTWSAVARARAEEALRQSQASLIAADRRKDEFLATLAHELRNPLAPIRNALHLLRVASDRVSTERVHEMLDRQVRHMVRLLDELLEVSRISRGVVELRRTVVDLGEVVADAIEASRPALDQKGHALELSLPRDAVLVEGDPLRLSQIVANLLNNAARYTDPQGRVELSLAREGPHALVRVCDSGIGIAADRLEEAFDMFGQLDPRDPHSQGGLGIGLSLARQLARLHGGEIEAASEGPGRGSCFTLRLTISAPRSA